MMMMMMMNKKSFKCVSIFEVNKMKINFEKLMKFKNFKLIKYRKTWIASGQAECK